MIELIIDNVIRIKENTLGSLVNILTEKFTYSNQMYYKKKAMGLYVSEKDKVVKTYERKAGWLLLPRGTIAIVKDILKSYNKEYTITDNRTSVPVTIGFKKAGGDLSEKQEHYSSELAKYSQRLFIAPPGMGKTRTMLQLASKIGQQTMIIVHTSEILKNWIEEANLYTDQKKIGQIGIGKKTIYPITIAMIQTLYNLDEEEWADINSKFGCIIISEAQHTPAPGFSRVVNNFTAKYRFGETASLTRKDGMEFLMYDCISSKIIEMPESELQEIKRSLPVSVEMIRSDIFVDQNTDWVSLVGSITTHVDRNSYIVGEIANDVRDDHVVVVLSDRKQHCLELQTMLKNNGIESIVLISTVPFKTRKALVKKVKNGKIKVILATTGLLSEGANIPILSCLHLVTPSNNFELTKQKVGRIRRICEGKQMPLVKDDVDINNDFLNNMAKNRKKYYHKLGFTVSERI